MKKNKLDSIETPEAGGGTFHKDAVEKKITKGKETQNILMSKISDFIKMVGEKRSLYKNDFSPGTNEGAITMISRQAVKCFLKKFREENKTLIDEYEKLYGTLGDEMIVGKEHYEALRMAPRVEQIEVISSIQDEVENKKIDLMDIITLTDKLEPVGKKRFLQNLSEQKNLSDNVLNLLMIEMDSKILGNLCSNSDILGSLLESLVQKLIGIAKGTEQIPLVVEIDEDDFDDEYYGDEETMQEEENQGPILMTDIKNFLSTLFDNPNLTTQQIDDLMRTFWESSDTEHRFDINICTHLNTPSWVLEKIYKIGPSQSKEYIIDNPNLSVEFKEQLQKVIQQEEEKNKKKQEIQDILEKHPNLDEYQVLQYYENKQDKETSKKIAESLAYDELGHYHYGSRGKYEKLEFKMQLVQKYNLGEELKSEIVYAMLGDNIVNHGSLLTYVGYDNGKNKSIYLSVPELEVKYGVKIEQEKIQALTKKILEGMLNRCDPSITDIERVYQFAETLGIEISDTVRKYYINAIINTIKKTSSRSLIDKFEYRYYFHKSFQLISEYKHLFSEQELQQYVMNMDERLRLPLMDVHSTIQQVQDYYYNEIYLAAKQDGFKDIKSMQGLDVFDLIEKLGLSENFRQNMARKKLEGCLAYKYEEGKKLMKEFNITRDELINLIINHHDTDGIGWNFRNEGEFSLERCLQKYEISPDEVIPSLLWKIETDVIQYIQKKEYPDAQKIIKRYEKYISDKSEFQELIETLKTLATTSIVPDEEVF